MDAEAIRRAALVTLHRAICKRFPAGRSARGGCRGLTVWSLRHLPDGAAFSFEGQCPDWLGSAGVSRAGVIGIGGPAVMVTIAL